MKILALETSAKSVSCAVVEDGAPLASAYQCTGLTHSRTLLPMVDAMLKNADLTLDDINAIAIAAGPGSFTGLRIGIAAVKGLAWAASRASAFRRSRPWRRMPRTSTGLSSARWTRAARRSITPFSRQRAANSRA